MLTRRFARLSIAALALAWLPAAASADLTVDWHTIDAGGGFSAGGVFELTATIGQPDAGVMAGGDFELIGGFWGAVTDAAPHCPGDADGDADVDITDLGLLLSNFGLGGPGIAGDVDGDDDVDITDLGILLSQFGAVCS